LKEECGDPLVADWIDQLLGYRGRAKIISTYIKPMLTDQTSPEDGRVHPNWKQCSTDTGRMSCDAPNAQNIPSRNKEDLWLRSVFVAEEGHLLSYIDLAQFEVRILAELSGEPDLIKAFQDIEPLARELEQYCQAHGLPEGVGELAEKKPDEFEAIVTQHPKVKQLLEELANRDFHRVTASHLFGVAAAEVTKQQRTNSKTISFALPYGAGPRAVADQSGIPVDEARQLIRDYEERFPRVAKWLEMQRLKARKGSTETAAGRKRFYQPPSFMKIHQRISLIKKDPKKRKEWEDLCRTWWSDNVEEIAEKQHKFQLGEIERAGTNMPVQGLNGDILKLGTILAGPRLRKLHREAMVIMFVHDELVVTAPKGVILEATEIVKRSLIEAGQRYLKRVPVAVSVVAGVERWGK
jgi:DNA polymerase-1